MPTALTPVLLCSFQDKLGAVAVGGVLQGPGAGCRH